MGPQSILSQPAMLNQCSVDLRYVLLTAQYAVETEHSVNAQDSRLCFTALLCHIDALSETLTRY